ncbi:hypothetical protein E2C01_072576 [Portunus trituberculatus]|uniref:Uncharacterized protein n=1 Tax=Portunus trituberculatus TaxID=210409 RepID=A0A5B7IB39_PORTR|nr:hypothetical protein [Portunus trituberculatus]
MGGNDRCLVSGEVLTRFLVDTSPRPPHSPLPTLQLPSIFLFLSAFPITRLTNPPISPHASYLMSLHPVIIRFYDCVMRCV